MKSQSLRFGRFGQPLGLGICAAFLSVLIGSAQAVLDENANGISDVWELVYYETSWIPPEPNEDFDGDGQSTLIESFFGTNPFEAASFAFVNAPTVDSTDAGFTFNSVAGVVYQPQTSLALDAVPAWSDFGDTVFGTGGVLPISVPRAGANKLFFRLEAVVPRPDVDGDGLDTYEEALFGSSDSTASTDADLLTDMEEFQLRQLGINVHPAQEFTERGRSQELSTRRANFGHGPGWPW